MLDRSSLRCPRGLKSGDTGCTQFPARNWTATQLYSGKTVHVDMCTHTHTLHRCRSRQYPNTIQEYFVTRAHIHTNTKSLKDIESYLLDCSSQCLCMVQRSALQDFNIQVHAMTLHVAVTCPRIPACSVPQISAVSVISNASLGDPSDLSGLFGLKEPERWEASAEEMLMQLGSKHETQRINPFCHRDPWRPTNATQIWGEHIG